MTLLTTEGIAAKPEIVPGISVELFPGHTRQLMAVHIESGGEHACYISDLIPTSAHLDPTWVMGYDLDPMESIAQRKRRPSVANTRIISIIANRLPMQSRGPPLNGT